MALITGIVVFILLLLGALLNSSNSSLPLISSTIYYSSQNNSSSCIKIPCSYVKNGNFTFLFSLSNNSVEEWYFPEQAYDYYESEAAYTPVISLKFDNGTSISTYDYRSLITPGFFANVVPSLTKGHTAKQFVNQVINLKNQLTTYSLVFQNTSVYPAVILAKGEGDCKDFGVLMASILEAGNAQANYGMKVQFVYVDAYNLSDPNTIDHLMLYVTFANGTILGNDGLCHAACGGQYTYCGTNQYCYNNQCLACASGSVLGSDGLCHQSCGTGYCNATSSCYNNVCISCPSGYYLGTDGQCHQN